MDRLALNGTNEHVFARGAETNERANEHEHGFFAQGADTTNDFFARGADHDYGFFAQGADRTNGFFARGADGTNDFFARGADHEHGFFARGADGTNGRTDGRTNEDRLWQRKALGHALRVIYEAHDFVGSTCGADARGFVTEERKRRVVRVNDALIPWYALLSHITDHASLRRCDALWGHDWQGRPKTAPAVTPGSVVVYMRVALQTGAFYVGETGAWEQRVKTHYMESFRHSDRCTNRCRGCREHRKYTLHRAAAPHLWVTIPLAVCGGKGEAKKLERNLILRWQPRLNQCESAPWLMKSQTYATELKKTRRGKRGGTKERKHTPPWRKDATGSATDDSSSVSSRSVDSDMSPPEGDYARYTTDEGTRFDCGAILKESVGRNVRITFLPGRHDVTSWSWLRAKYGPSLVTITDRDGTYSTTIREWRPRSGAQSAARLIVRVEEDDELNSQPDVDLESISTLTETLKVCSEESLAQYWAARNALDRESRIRVRTMIWDECERRYEGFTRKPLELRLPFFHEVSAYQLRKLVLSLIDGAEAWPSFLRDWHKQKMRIVSEAPKSIEDVLCNVNRPTLQQHTCACAQVKRQLKEGNRYCKLPKVDGHIFFIGRDFPADDGALSICESNGPRQTQWDLERAWESMRMQFPEELRLSANEWKRALKRVQTVRIPRAGVGFPTTRDVYTLRKALRGLVIGPLDKNKGELWACCPVLYQKALAKLYSPTAGYERLHVAALTAYRQRRYKGEELERQICRTEPVTRGNTGDARDIINLWKRIYKARGWSRYASFDTRGGFNIPYLLMKAKNVTDPAVRKEKWMKARPIAPGTRHPMRRLLHLVGRAWYFLAKRDECGDSFVIERSEDVPAFLEMATRMVSQQGPVAYTIKDIEGCYPAMPKEAIRMAMREHILRIESTSGQRGVSVPRFSDTQRCEWRKRPASDKRMVWLPFQVMLDVMNFALDHAIIQMPDGTLMRQSKGIPMGDPLSPSMCVLTAAWMETEWMESLATRDKAMFAGRRFMDDILLLYAEAEGWDHDRFLSDFCRSECYWPPLTLEDAKEATS